jgi:hypothetical protein
MSPERTIIGEHIEHLRMPNPAGNAICGHPWLRFYPECSESLPHLVGMRSDIGVDSCRIGPQILLNIIGEIGNRLGAIARDSANPKLAI